MFPQTFVISMTRSVERRRDVINHLNSLNIDFEFVDAVDGNTLSEDFIKHTNDAALQGEIGRTLSPGEIGCALSHLGVYQKIVAEGGGPYLILEDDVELSRAFMEIIERVELFPPNWELINFCGSSPPLAFGAPLWDIYRPARFRGNPSFTVAYLITVSGAKKLLKHGVPLRLTADALTGRAAMTGVNLYGIFPQVVGYRPVPTTISGRKNQEPKPRGPVRQFLRHRLQRLVWRI